MHATGLPTVPPAVPQLPLSTIGWPVIVTGMICVDFAPTLSVTVALTLNVPFAEYIVVKLVTFPAEDGLPPGADQLNT